MATNNPYTGPVRDYLYSVRAAEQCANDIRSGGVDDAGVPASYSHLVKHLDAADSLLKTITNQRAQFSRLAQHTATAGRVEQVLTQCNLDNPGKASTWEQVDQLMGAATGDTFEGELKTFIRNDPDMRRVPLFADYQHRLLRYPKKGHPDTTFAYGVGHDDQLTYWSWDSDQPHLLVAGSKGMGQSELLDLMLAQLMYNNDPTGVEVWMLASKNRLQAYQHVEHVKVFVDPTVTSMTDEESAAHTLEAAVNEMHTRFQQFASHQDAPANLAAARAAAAADPEGSGHLMFPWLFIVVDECVSYFTQLASPAADEMRFRLSDAMSQLARRGRAAGIHLVLATEHPTRQSIPVPVKRQCRTIGFSTDGDEIASKIIHGDTGLAFITGQGFGLVRTGSKVQPFRSLLVEDVNEVVSRLPASTQWPKLPETVTVSPLVNPSTDRRAA